MAVLEHGETEEGREQARDVFRDMARKLDAVRQRQLAQEKVTPTPGINFIDHEAGDYLLLDSENQIQGVSGNSEFWDIPDEGKGSDVKQTVDEYGDEYTIVMVVRVHEAR